MNLRPYFNWFKEGTHTIWKAFFLVFLCGFICGFITWMAALTLGSLWLQNTYSLWGAAIGSILGIIIGIFEKKPMTKNRAVNVVASLLIVAFCGAFFGTLFSRNNDALPIAIRLGWIGLLIGLFLGVAFLVYDWQSNK